MSTSRSPSRPRRCCARSRRCSRTPPSPRRPRRLDPVFDTLSGRLDGIFKKLRSRGKLHPKQVDSALTEMRTALLEADVAVEVANDLLERVHARALSEEVMKSLTPSQQVTKVVREELQATMGGTHAPFSLPR